MKSYNSYLERLLKKYQICKKRKVKGFYKTKKVLYKALDQVFEHYVHERNNLFIFTDASKIAIEKYVILPKGIHYCIVNDMIQLEEMLKHKDANRIVIMTQLSLAYRYACQLYNLDATEKADIINIYDYLYEIFDIEVVHDFWTYHFALTAHDFVRHIFCLLKHFYCKYSGVRLVIRNVWGRSVLEDEIGELCRIFCVKKKYEIAENVERKVFYLQILLQYCFENRDLKTALEYLDILENELHFYCYNALKNKIEMMLGEMREKIKTRTTEDIIINWIDAVCYQNIEDLPYVCKTAKTGVNFSSAYTSMPWTSWTIKTMFCGKGVIEGELWKESKVTETNSILLEQLREKGYEFWYAGPEEIRKKVFGEDRWLSRSAGTWVPSTRYLWDALDKLSSDSKKQCILIHEFVETHSPIFSIKSKKFTEHTASINEVQRKDCRLYIDEQIKWFDSFLEKNITEIYMSDHGDRTQETVSRYGAQIGNILMSIKSERLEKKEYTKFFCITKFPYLLGGEHGMVDIGRKRIII